MYLLPLQLLQILQSVFKTCQKLFNIQQEKYPPIFNKKKIIPIEFINILQIFQTEGTLWSTATPSSMLFPTDLIP